MWQLYVFMYYILISYEYTYTRIYMFIYIYLYIYTSIFIYHRLITQALPHPHSRHACTHTIFLIAIAMRLSRPASIYWRPPEALQPLLSILLFSLVLRPPSSRSSNRCRGCEHPGPPSPLPPGALTGGPTADIFVFNQIIIPCTLHQPSFPAL